MLRWLIFLFVGLPIQGVVYVIYPIVYLLWSIFIFRPVDHKALPHHQAVPASIGSATTHNGALLDTIDDHGAFSMYGLVQREGLELLQVDGSLIRRRAANDELNRWAISGDVVVSWLFANAVADRKVSNSILENVVGTYMKNLGTLSYDEVAQGYVSTRCSNFGVNIAEDSDFLKLSQPALGPQFYTTSALLASAYDLGFKYKAMFWAHWVVMGGWYWAWAPALFVKQDDLVYVRDISMKALYVHLQVFGPQWWITKPMEFINDKVGTHKNDLWDAMMGREPGPLPESMNSFFSQYSDASSYENDRMSAYIPEAIRKIKRETKYK